MSRIEQYVKELFKELSGIHVGTWHSDVEDEKRKQLELHPPIILITTLKSLEMFYLLYCFMYCFKSSMNVISFLANYQYKHRCRY